MTIQVRSKKKTVNERKLSMSSRAFRHAKDGAIEYPIAVNEVVVAAKAAVDIVIQTSVNVRPVRLEVPEDVAPSFTVKNMRVNASRLFHHGEDIPAVVFVKDVLPISFGQKLAPANEKTPMILTVENRTDYPQRFVATVFGKVVA